MRLSRVAVAAIAALTVMVALVLLSVAEPSTPAYAADSLPEPSDTGATVFIDQPAQQNDDEADVLLMALLTVGAAGAAAVVSLIGYFIRNRVGFWLHRPPPRDDRTPDEHH